MNYSVCRNAWAPALMGLLVIALLTGGCNTSQPGVTNSFGTLSQTLEATPSDAVAAAETAVEELDLTLLETRWDYDDNSARLVIESADGYNVSIRVEPAAGEQVDLSVRYGVLGDREFGMTILERVKSVLGVEGDPQIMPVPDPA